MKKLIFTFLCIASIFCKAQTLEHSYPENVFLTKISDTEYVYQSFDIISKTLKIYNINHSLIKTIVLNTSDPISAILHLSKTLFNLDQQFEFVSYSTNAPYSVKVFDESGNVFFTKNTTAFAYPNIRNTNNGTKLVIADSGSSSVYSLTGTVQGIKPLDNDNLKLSFPNPANDYILIHTEENNIVDIIDLNGKIIQSYNADGISPLDISNLKAGVYYYRINGIETSKFIKQ